MGQPLDANTREMPGEVFGKATDRAHCRGPAHSVLRRTSSESIAFEESAPLWLYELSVHTVSSRS
jgi:hypothetical protein